MAFWDMGFRNIVDVDGQLLAIDADLIDPAALLAKANLNVDQPLWLIRAGEYHFMQPRQFIRLTQDEVLFFETSPVTKTNMAELLAA